MITQQLVERRALDEVHVLSFEANVQWLTVNDWRSQRMDQLQAHLVSNLETWYL